MTVRPGESPMGTAKRHACSTAQDLPPTMQTRYGDVVVLIALRLRQAVLGPALEELASLLAGAPPVCHAGIPRWMEHGAIFHRRNGAR
jgi:hypothetical protein